MNNLIRGKEGGGQKLKDLWKSTTIVSGFTNVFEILKKHECLPRQSHIRMVEREVSTPID